MISIQICTNRDAIANFFIVPPPPIVRKRWAQQHVDDSLIFIISQNLSNRLYYNMTFSKGTQLGVAAAWPFFIDYIITNVG